MQLRRHAGRVASVALAWALLPALGLVTTGVGVAGGAVDTPGAPAGGRPGGPSGPVPVVTPASGGGGVPVVPGFTAFDPADVGYRQSEVFLSGTAEAYGPTAPFGTDGRYEVEPTGTAPYTTRAVVMRPERRSDFNGTVIVEWFNVSGGADAGPDWMMAHNELVRGGYAYVGISAQRVGVDALRSTDPLRGDAVRYAGLSHPGDSYSYDIFTQAARAVREEAPAVLGGLRPRRVIAVGESQSAIRLTTYIDAVHPLVGEYDGYLVHSRFAGGAPLSQPPLPAVPVPSPAPIRDDLDVPVLVFQTETDVLNSLVDTRTPDTRSYRLWEVAGTAHFDQYGLDIGRNDIGDGSGAVADLAAMRDPTTQPNPMFTCADPINTGPAHYVLDAAVARLDRWVRDGVPPPRAPRLETTGTPARFVTDEHGNVRGGIRTPAVDAPVATLSGLARPGGTGFCFLFGTTTPFTDAQLTALYPTDRAFDRAWARAARSAHRAGFLTATDTRHLVAAARTTTIVPAPVPAAG